MADILNDGISIPLRADNRTAAGIDGAKRNLKGLEQASETTSQRMVASAIRTAAAYIGLRTAIRATISVFQAWGGYEEALVDMRKVTDESITQIDKKIRSLPAELGNATQLMQGYYQTISAGVKDSAKAMDVLTTAAKAAKAAHIEQAEVIKGLTKILAGYDGEVKDATEAADLLFRIEKEGQTTFAELIPVVGGLALLSHELSVSANEMGGSLALITQTAANTAEASTRLEGLFVALMKPTENLKAAYKDLGFTTAQAAIKELGFVETMRQLVDWARKADIPLAQLFQRKEALLALATLAGKDFRTLGQDIESMGQKAGGTERAFNDWKVELNATVDTIKNSLHNALIQLGKDLVNLGKSVEQATRDSESWIEKWSKNIGEAINKADTWLSKMGFGSEKVREFYELQEKINETLGKHRGAIPLEIPKIPEVAMGVKDNSAAQREAIEEQRRAMEFQNQWWDHEEEVRMQATSEKQVQAAADMRRKIMEQNQWWDQQELQRVDDLYDKQAKLTQEYEEKKNQIRTNAMNSFVGLLQILGAKSKAAAVVALMVDKGLAIAQTYIYGLAASIRAIKDLGPVAGPPMAAAIMAWTKINMALIAATGLAQAMNMGAAPRAAGGTAGEPLPASERMTPYEKEAYGSGWRPGQGQQGYQVNIHVYGDVNDAEKFVEKVDAAARKIIGDPGAPLTKLIVRRANA